MTSGSSGRKPTANPQTDTKSAGVGTSGQDRPRPEGTEDTLESVEADIASYKAEQKVFATGGLVGSEGIVPLHNDFVFACTGIDETGYGDELVCICGSEGPDEFGNYDQLEHKRCPIHGEAD